MQVGGTRVQGHPVSAPVLYCQLPAAAASMWMPMLASYPRYCLSLARLCKACSQFFHAGADADVVLCVQIHTHAGVHAALTPGAADSHMSPAGAEEANRLVRTSSRAAAQQLACSSPSCLLQLQLYQAGSSQAISRLRLLLFLAEDERGATSGARAALSRGTFVRRIAGCLHAPRPAGSHCDGMLECGRR